MAAHSEYPSKRTSICVHLDTRHSAAKAQGKCHAAKHRKAADKGRVQELLVRTARWTVRMYLACHALLILNYRVYIHKAPGYPTTVFGDCLVDSSSWRRRFNKLPTFAIRLFPIVHNWQEPRNCLMTTTVQLSRLHTINGNGSISDRKQSVRTMNGNGPIPDRSRLPCFLHAISQLHTLTRHSCSVILLVSVLDTTSSSVRSSNICHPRWYLPSTIERSFRASTVMPADVRLLIVIDKLHGGWSKRCRCCWASSSATWMFTRPGVSLSKGTSFALRYTLQAAEIINAGLRSNVLL